MIGVIGTEEDTVGFGLAGVGKLRTLDTTATKSDVLQAVADLKEVTAIIIAERLHDMIRGEKAVKDLLMIDIPSKDADPADDRIARLTKELLGVELQ